MNRHVVSITAIMSILMPVAAHAEAVTPRQIREGKVTACSSFGGGCYTAKLVRSSVGWKLQLNNGTIINCGVTCQDTLRVQTVDFWQDQREPSR